MPTPVGSMVAVLGLDKKPFTRQLRLVERELDGAKGRMSRIGRALGKAAIPASVIAAGAAVIGAGFAVATKRAFELADSIDKASKRLGINVEALQELRFAAQRAGVDIRTFDMGMQRFTRRLGEARRGTGEALFALKELEAILGEDLVASNLSAEDALGKVADALSQVEDPTQRVRLAFKLFDSEGVRLIQVLQNGSDELNRMRQRAQDLGAVMTQDMVDGLVEAKDQLSDLSQVLQIQTSIAIAENADTIRDWAESAIEAAVAVGRWIEGMRDLDSLGTSALKRQIAETEAELERLRDLPPIEVGIFGGIFQKAEVQDRINKELEAQRKLHDLRGRLGAREGAAVEAPESAGLGLSEKEIQAFGRARKEQEKAAQRFEATIQRVADELRKLEIGEFEFKVQQTTEELEKWGEAAGKSAAEIERARAATVGQLEQARQITLEKEWQAETDRLIRDELETQIEQYETMRSDLEGIVQGPLQGLLSGSLEAGEAGQLLLQNVLQLIAAKSAELIIERTLGKFFKDEIQTRKELLAIEKQITTQRLIQAGVAAGSSGATATGGAGGTGTGGLVGALGKILGLAEGGVVRRPTFAMIGERGPEAVIPLSMFAGGGGRGLNVTVINNGQPVDVQSARERQSAFDRDIEIVIESVASRSMQTGRLGQTMEQTFDVPRRATRR